uniref:RAB11 family interacting protein 5 n=1 Tax=Athene cunicularia TaxID=194338 RepID=A0A663NCC5_ATHCN
MFWRHFPCSFYLCVQSYGTESALGVVSGQGSGEHPPVTSAEAGEAFVLVFTANVSFQTLWRLARGVLKSSPFFLLSSSFWLPQILDISAELRDLEEGKVMDVQVCCILHLNIRSSQIDPRAVLQTGLSFTFLSGSRWYKLHSKAGKKEKERGEILVSIQFTRNNLTASMFDLSMKDKPRSPFGKLKDKVKGKKKYDLESASAIIPSSMGALDMEDDYDIGGKKSKVKGFFLKNKLRKSSLTQSNTSLGSDSTISSASLSLAANVPEVTKSPSRHSSLSTERSDYLPSPKLTHKRAFSDDVSQVSPVLEPKAIHSLKPKNDPVSRSSLCINGSHVYSDEPAPKSPVSVPQSSAPLAVPSVPRRSEEGFVFVSLPPDSHEVPWGVSTFERTQQRDEPRFIPSPPSLALQEELKVSTKAVTLSNHLGRAKMEENSRLENKPTQAAIPMVFSTETTKDKPPEEMRKEDKRAKGGLFHHGGNKSDAGSKGQGEKVGPSHGSSVHATAGGDERNKTSSWFGSKEPKESPQKPRSVKWGVVMSRFPSRGIRRPPLLISLSTSSILHQRGKTGFSGAAVFIRLAECSSRFLPQDPAVLDQSAKYYHLTHDELIQLLLQREKELSKKEEHIQELENYIDQLLVRIMEQSPTLLQIPLGENTTK